MDIPKYNRFTREEWSALRFNTPLTLSEAEITALRGLGDVLSVPEAVDIYLPLSRLLNLHVRAAKQLGSVKDEFLGRFASPPPYVIAIGGSVAAGKSTLSRVLRAMLSRWPDHPRVDLVTTDGFLRPNAWLQEHGLMERKGFPESYDMRTMVEFLARVKAGDDTVSGPVYSHETYDVVPGKSVSINRPDILIFEGLNVLQAGYESGGAQRRQAIILSDFFDFSIYLDADESCIESWYIERFLLLQKIAFQHPESYFHHYAGLSPADATDVARQIWRDVNLVKLKENILPTRERAHLVLRKQADHGIAEILLRQT